MREPGRLQVVVIGNSLRFELVIVARSMATVPVLVNVTTPPVNVLPTTVFGNEKLSGVIVICGTGDDTPLPDIASVTLPALVVVIVI